MYQVLEDNSSTKSSTTVTEFDTVPLFELNSSPSQLPPITSSIPPGNFNENSFLITTNKIFSKLKNYFISTAVVLFMVSSASITQKIQSDYEFHKPAFMIWFSTSWMISCFPIHFGVCIWKLWKIRDGRKNNINYNGKIGVIELIRDISIFEIFGGKELVISRMKYGILFTALWIAANVLFVMGIARTDVASSLSLEQASVIFVFFLSALFLQEAVTPKKICIGGVLIIALTDYGFAVNGDGSFFGDLLIIASSLSAAVYMVAYKKILLSTDDIAAVHLLLGFIGVWDLILFTPVVVILHYTHVEEFVLPTGEVAGLLVIGALLSFMFNYLLNLGMYFTSPLFLRVGQICAIPGSFFVQLVIFGEPLNLWEVFGCIIILLGFVLFNTPTEFCNKRQRDDEEEESV